MKKRSQKKMPLFIADADKAMKDAVRKAIQEHAESGNPIAIWKNGKVVWIPAKKLLAREPQAEYGVKKQKKKR